MSLPTCPNCSHESVEWECQDCHAAVIPFADMTGLKRAWQQQARRELLAEIDAKLADMACRWARTSRAGGLAHARVVIDSVFGVAPFSCPFCGHPHVDPEPPVCEQCGKTPADWRDAQADYEAGGR